MNPEVDTQNTPVDADDLSDDQIAALFSGDDDADLSDPDDVGVDDPSDLFDPTPTDPYVPTATDIKLAKKTLAAGDCPSIPLADLTGQPVPTGWRRLKSFKVEMDSFAKPDARHKIISLKQFLSAMKTNVGYALTGTGRGFVRVTAYGHSKKAKKVA